MFVCLEGCGAGRGSIWRCERWKEMKEETEGVFQATWEARVGRHEERKVTGERKY